MEEHGGGRALGGDGVDGRFELAEGLPAVVLAEQAEVEEGGIGVYAGDPELLVAGVDDDRVRRHWGRLAELTSASVVSAKTEQSLFTVEALYGDLMDVFAGNVGLFEAAWVGHLYPTRAFFIKTHVFECELHVVAIFQEKRSLKSPAMRGHSDWGRSGHLNTHVGREVGVELGTAFDVV